MTGSTTLIPRPSANQIALLTHLWPKIEHGNAARRDRGLVIVTYNSGNGGYVLGFTPARQADLPHVLAQGLPEEAAVHVVEKVKSYNDLSEIPVLLLERLASGKDIFSFVCLDVRPLPPAGVVETRH